MKTDRSLTRGTRVPSSLFLTCPLAVLAAPLVLTLGSAKEIGFALLLALVLLSAVAGGTRAGLLTGLAAAVGLLGGAWFLERGNNGFVELFRLLPIAQAALLPGFGVWLGWHLDIARHRAEQLGETCQRYEQSVDQLSKDSKQVAAAAEQERIRRQQEEAQRLELSRLFLNLQHLGRELSGNLETGAVARLVSDAAKKLLNAPRPRLFLLDQQTGELVEHTPGSCGDRRPADRGMLGWVVSHGQVITAEDTANIHSLASLNEQDSAEWQACAPLAVGQRVLGVLAIDAIESKTPEFERLLYILANFSAVALNNSRLFQRVEHMARHDGLTGLLNQTALLSKFDELLQEAKRDGRPLALVIWDLDHFKQFNDRYGHQAGDHVLSSAAQLWKRLMPQHALAGRYGGEEFVCLLPDSELEPAVELAECLRTALEQQGLEFEGTALAVTASFGVAAFPANGRSSASLFRAADAALYAAKRNGRNRVSAAACDPPEHAAARVSEAEALASA